MQRREAHISFQNCKHRPINQDWPVVVGSAVDDTVADGNEVEFLVLPQPTPCFGDCCSDVSHLVARILSVDQDSPVIGLGAQPRPGADTVHLSFDEPRQACISINPIDLKLDTGGTGIDHKYGVHGTSHCGYCQSATAGVGIKDCSRAGCHTASH